MNQKYSNYKLSSKMIVWGLITMLLSLVACVIHIFDIQNTYLQQQKDAYTNQIIIAKSSLEHQILEEYEIVNKFVEKIEFLYAETSKDDLLLLLNEPIRSEKYVRVSLFDIRGMEYISAGEVLHIVNTYELLQINDGQLLEGVLAENEDGLYQTYFLLTNDIIKYGKKVGSVKAYIECSNVYEASSFDYFDDIGYCYLTDMDYMTLSLSTSTETYTENGLSFLSMLANVFGESLESKNYYQNLFHEMENEQEGAKYIEAENGEIYLVAYETFSNDIYLVAYFNIAQIMDDINSVVFRTALTCIFIIVLMIALLMFVWLSSMKTTFLVEKMAYEDEVTKGKNLNYFKVRFYEIMKMNKSAPYLVERFDIANFRYINEAYGHNRADELLKACLQIAEQIFLEYELCARMDSDQFVILIINDSSSEVRWAKYLQEVNEYARTIGIKYPIRFKVGIYKIREFDKEIDMMIDRANAARKLISSDSKIMVREYSDSIVEEMRRVDRIESDMHRALQDGEFQVYLQQKWNINTNRLHGAEALIRWVKPGGEVILPSEFIPLFEKNGFIEKLDYFVLETVCAKQKEMIDAGKKCVPISVNQSKVLWNNTDYVRNVERIINRYNIPKEIIVLEVTETVFLNDVKTIEKIVKDLKKLGVQVSMDDFGSGYSSLNLLKDISFDVLKIDKGFVSDSLTSEKSRWILRKIIEMADGLGMSVVCEGIETKEQLDNARRIGCIIIQGFFYGKPIAMNDFCERYVENKK